MPAARNCRGMVLHKGAVAPDQDGEASRLSDSRLHSLADARSTSWRRPLPNIALQQIWGGLVLRDDRLRTLSDWRGKVLARLCKVILDAEPDLAEEW